MKWYLYILIGVIIGLMLYDRFLKPETITHVEYIETIKTDTVYITKTEQIPVTSEKIVTIYERDTIVIDFNPKIKGFKRVFTLVNGNVTVNGEVFGELTKIGLTSDLKLPIVTNTITKEKTSTIVKQPTGLFATGGINSNFSASVGATYLKNNSLIGYDYQFNGNVHSVKVGFKVF